MSYRRPEFDDRYTQIPESGCWLWEGPYFSDGYGQLTIERKPVRAHRFMWRRIYGEIPEGLQVLHKCDVRCCVNPAHLFIGTHLDNMRDKVRKGRCRDQRGIKHNDVKLNEAQVLAIRSDLRSNTAVALELGVSHQLISKIRKRKLWKHI